MSKAWVIAQLENTVASKRFVPAVNVPLFWQKQKANVAEAHFAWSYNLCAV